MAIGDLIGTVGDFAVKAAFTFAGAAPGFWLGYSARRPKLEIIGSGGSHIPNKVMTTNTIVYNRPSFFGLPMNREAATIVKAYIYDPELKAPVEPNLRWLNQEGGQELIRECTMASGREATLYLFAKEPSNLDEFFVFAPNRTDEPPKECQRALTKYKDKKKEFVLVLLDVNNRVYRYEFTARNSEQGVSVGFRTNKLRARWDLLRKALVEACASRCR